MIGYRPDIDGLRALAVLAVIGFHAAPTALPNGYLGVDVFFVISGYLITGLALREQATGHFDWRSFYWRRVRRLAPALLLVLIVTLIVATLLMQPQELRAVGASTSAASLWVANLYFWRHTGYFGEAASAQPLLHLWSLGVEEQFYLLFPLLLWGVRRAGWALVAVLFVASWALNTSLYTQHPAASFFLLPMRAWELLAGCALAGMHHHQAFSRIAPGFGAQLSWLAAVLLVGVLLAPRVTGQTGLAGQWLIVGATIALLHTGWCKNSAGASRWLSVRPLVGIGLMSYSLYLWHHPVLSLLQLGNFAASPWWQTGQALLLTALLSWLSWRWVEAPLRRAQCDTRSVALALTASLGLAAAGAWLWWNHGAWKPLTPPQRAVATHQYDFATPYRLGQCFLSDSQVGTDFERCETSGTGQGRTLVWGDSYAAHWIPGLQERGDLYSALVQRTVSGCAPGLLGNTDPLTSANCQALQVHVLNELPGLQPDRIVLAARWRPASILQLDTLVAALRARGVQDIVILGNTPEWRGGLPGWLLALDASDWALPATMTPPQLEDQKQLNRLLRMKAQALGVRFVDAWAAACPTEAQCFVTTDKAISGLVYWDRGHLTATGSRKLASALHW